MSWLTPERRAQFLELQQQNLQEDEDVGQSTQLLENKPGQSLAHLAKLGLHDVHGEDGQAGSRRAADWHHPVEALNGPEGVVTHQEEPFTGKLDRLEQQSSGNITRKLRHEDYLQALPEDSHSTPALHLEHFVARKGQLLEKKRTVSTVPSVEIKTSVRSTTGRQSGSVRGRAGAAHATARKRSGKISQDSMMFFDSTGTYNPPAPTAKINRTRTQQLREEQLSKSRDLAKRTERTVSGRVLRASGPEVDNEAKADNLEQLPARKETLDHASRIMNSRTEQRVNTSSPTLTAAQRYRNFIKSTTNSATPRRGNAGKQRMVERKIDDVFRRLSDDVVSPPLRSSHGAFGEVGSLKVQERNWNKPNLASSHKQTIVPQLTSTRKETFVATHKSPASHQKSSRFPLPSQRRAAKKIPSKKNPEEARAKPKKLTSKPTQHPNKKKNAKTIEESNDGGTSTSDFSTTSLDSSAISFPSEATTATSEASDTDESRPKSKEKKSKAKKPTLKRQMLHIPSHHSKPAKVGDAEEAQKIKPEKVPVAFGRAMPRPKTPVGGPVLSLTVPSKPSMKTSSKASHVPGKKLPGKASGRPKRKVDTKPETTNTTSSQSDDTSGDTSDAASIQAMEDTSDTSATTDGETGEDSSSAEVQPSAEDIVKSLARKWQAEKSGSSKNFASNSETFSTPDSKS